MEDETVAVNTATSTVLQAVDPTTFAQSTIWMPDNSSQPIGSLLTQLAARRTAAIQSGIIPAIVDSSTWNTLALHVGATFSLYPAGSSGAILHYLAMAEVQHLPGINSSAEGGLVVDYQSFAAVQMEHNLPSISVNHIWLHTHNDPVSLASVRAALSTSALHLNQLYDRQSLADGLRHDPLSLNLVGLLALGATTAFLLALVGNLLTSWLSVRRRLTNFTVLRAMGATPKQIASVLIWEQGIIYVAALFLGIILGALLVVTTIPKLVFSALPLSAGMGDVSANALYALQQIIPPQIVVPVSLGIAFIMLVLTCVIALSIMIRVVVQPSMSQVLRLDETQSIEFLVREDAVIARSRSQQAVSQRRRQSARLSTLSLARWQLRQVWWLLLIQAIGLVAAVTLVCTVPLFSTVTKTAELHDVLTASPDTPEITLDAFTQGLSTNVFEYVQHQINPLFQHYLGASMSQPSTLSIQAAGFRLLSSTPANSQDEVRLIGTSMEQAAPNSPPRAGAPATEHDERRH